MNQPTGRARRLGILVNAGLVLGAATATGLFASAVLAARGQLPGIPPTDYSHGFSTGDLAGLAVAGGTVLLADTTALLAWLTWRSIAETRREAEIAERALAAAQEQARI